MLALLIAAEAATVDPGPLPDRAQAIGQIESAIRSRLIDPQSAQFTWPYDFSLLTSKGLFAKRVTGWTTCGTVNSRNRMGGYAGATAVRVTLSHGQIVGLNMADGLDTDPVQSLCDDAVRKGLLHPAAPMAQARPDAAALAARGSLGIAYMPSPVGAVIMAVAPGSPAARAGLKQGETIEAAGGVSLKGMDTTAAGAVFNGLGSDFNLTVSGVGIVHVTR